MAKTKKLKIEALDEINKDNSDEVPSGDKTTKDLKQSKIFSCVIEANKKSNVGGFDVFKYDMDGDRFSKCVNQMALFYSCDYWYILHDKDTLEDGSIKRKHYHLVLRFPTRHVPNAVVSMLADYFGINENRVSCKRCSSLESSIRYLNHEDETDPLKYRYEYNLVKTNDYETLQLARSASLDKISTSFLLDVVRSTHSVREIILKVGADNYVKYRWLIYDLVNGIRKN